MFALLTRVFNMDVIDRTIVNPFKMIIFSSVRLITLNVVHT